MEEKYLKALQMCIGSDPNREWMLQPFRIEDIVFATDAHIMLMVPKTLAPSIKTLEDYPSQNVLQILPENRMESFVIKTDRLQDALSKCSIVPETAECEACDGDEYVYFSFTWDGEEYTKSYECPICNGKGEVVIKDSMVSNPKEVIKIGISAFKNIYIKKLLDISLLFGVTEITLTWQNTELNKSIFRIGFAELLIMPCEPPTAESIVDSIEI